MFKGLQLKLLNFWYRKKAMLISHNSGMNKAVLEPRVSPAFAITYFCNHCNIRFENTSKYVDTLTLFSKNLNQWSLTPRWPLTSCLLRSHVWLYPRIIVSKSHDNTSMYVDTVINFAKYHIHTTYIQRTYYVHTTDILRTEWVITSSLTELSSGKTKMIKLWLVYYQQNPILVSVRHQPQLLMLGHIIMFSFFNRASVVIISP